MTLDRRRFLSDRRQIATGALKAGYTDVSTGSELIQALAVSEKVGRQSGSLDPAEPRDFITLAQEERDLARFRDG